ncbi:cytochrome c biogenesis heme-transporting ATPase CcmA [Alteromonas sp. NFXS44]
MTDRNIQRYVKEDSGLSGLVASKLTCIKRDRVLFEDLSFQLLPGQLIYLRGPNGAGKTSLLRILSGLSQPQSGSLLWQGKPLGEDWFTSLIYIGHKAGINGTLSPLENLQFWCAQHNVSFNEDNLYDVLALVGLVGMEDVPCRTLSAGQLRRAALARLWLKQADVWILDEPFTALDIRGVAQLEDKMCEHASNGGAVLITSHQTLSHRAGGYKTFDLEYRF